MTRVGATIEEGRFTRVVRLSFCAVLTLAMAAVLVAALALGAWIVALLAAGFCVPLVRFGIATFHSVEVVGDNTVRLRRLIGSTTIVLPEGFTVTTSWGGPAVLLLRCGDRTYRLTGVAAGSVAMKEWLDLYA